MCEPAVARRVENVALLRHPEHVALGVAEPCHFILVRLRHPFLAIVGHQFQLLNQFVDTGFSVARVRLIVRDAKLGTDSMHGHEEMRNCRSAVACAIVLAH